MFHVYAVKCRFHDVGIIRHALADIATVTTVELSQLASVSPPPDIIFFGFGSGLDDLRDSEEERRIRNLATTSILLRKIRSSLSFRDVPILIVIEKKDIEDSEFTTQYGASGFLIAPLDEENIRKVVSEAMKPVGAQSSIDVRLVNPFVNATLLVLEKMAKTQATRREVLLKKDYRLFGEISAIIGITGDGVEGSVGLTFQEDLARDIVSRMWERPLKELSREEIYDGLGELVNVICGQATTELSRAEKQNYALALPTIVTGFGHEITQHSGTPCLSIVFEASQKVFAVQVAIKSR